MRGPPSGWATLLVLVLAGVLGLWAGAQALAWLFAFHPNLGAPVLELAGVPLYAPLRYLVWLTAYRRVPALSGVLWESAYAAGAVGVVVFVGGMVLLRRRRRTRPSSHGTARWGDARALLRDPEGLIVGRDGTRLLRYDPRGEPVLTFAPTGAGKGVSVVIPNLLDYPGSVLVTDPKGELAAVTARRRREMGQRVHVLDPWRLVGGEGAYNPLDLVDAGSEDAVDDARLLAQMLVVEKGGADGGYWNAEAREVLTALILHVASTAAPAERHLPHVRLLLTLPPDDLEALLEEMRDNEVANGLVSRSAAAQLDRATRSPKEYLGVLNTARSHTHFLDSPRMARVLRASSFDPARLKQGRTTVYLVLPADRLDTYAAWMRLVIACTLTSLSRTRGASERPVLLLLDEAGQLGRMEPIERAVSLGRGYGMQLWLLFQSLSQVEASYGRQGRSFLANAGLIQAFGVAEPETADYFSKLTGEATIRVESENESRGVSGGGILVGSHVQRGRAVTGSETGRRLLTPDEVRRLSRAEQLLFVRGEDPLRCARVDYRAAREFRGRHDPNPMHLAES